MTAGTGGPASPTTAVVIDGVPSNDLMYGADKPEQELTLLGRAEHWQVNVVAALDLADNLGQVVQEG
ncbi:hypothetical protein [Kutzneria sp. CA-103260]|uniref:hypothetical protein n=1 Tax=Kutzneria sp. CA-103260 TaxID=2802641 RepID=UPI001BA8252B|nr:hypothetical protein [Kutzneria sp. CA-103260]QUQ68253.1 hypothetical protein JJ691_59980 [Kutzneria sp. CA-103260]